MKLKALFIISVCLGCLWSLSAFAQVPDSLWTRYYGGSNDQICYGVSEALDQGLILAGDSRGDTTSFAVLVKTNSQGFPLWMRNYGRHHQATGVVALSGGGYMTGGVSSLNGSDDFWMMRVNADGDSMWSRTFGGAEADYSRRILQTSDGSFILAGSTGSFGAGQSDAWLVKTDANGGGLWSRTYGSGGTDGCYSIAQTTDGGFILGGVTDSLGTWGEADALLVKTNSLGDTAWIRTFGGQYGDFFYSVQQASDGGYIAAGAITPSLGEPYDFFVVKTDANGNGMWTRTFGAAGDDECSEVRVLQDGGFILSGPTGSYGVHGYGTLIVRTNAFGDTLWTRVLRPDTTGYPFCGTLVSDGGYVMAGGELSSNGDANMMAMKLGAIPLAASDNFVLQPSSFTLSAYPNPFNPSTAIRFSLSRDDAVKLRVYDVNGRLVQTLLERTMPAGEHRIMFEAGNLPSGMYIARLENSAVSKSEKLMLVK